MLIFWYRLNIPLSVILSVSCLQFLSLHKDNLCQVYYITYWDDDDLLFSSDLYTGNLLKNIWLVPENEAKLCEELTQTLLLYYISYFHRSRRWMIILKLRKLGKVCIKSIIRTSIRIILEILCVHFSLSNSDGCESSFMENYIICCFRDLWSRL